MKLRNLLFGTMIACAFASCSNDDDPINNGPDGNDGKTILTAKFDIPAASKAVTDDAAIESLHMLVFSNGTLEVIGELKSGTSDESEAAVNLADKEVLMVANVTLPQTVTPGAAKEAVLGALSGSKALKYDGSAETVSMNSKLYTGITVTPETTNYLGWSEVPAAGGALVGGISEEEAKATVKMYRNAAKVILTTIQSKEGYTGEDRIAYKAPQLDVENVYILQANQFSMIAPTGGAVYGSTELTEGYISGGFTVGINFESDKYALQASTLEESYVSTLTGTATTTTALNINKPFYVFENTKTDKNNSTLLVVAGKFSYVNQNGDRVYIKDADGEPAVRYYPIAVGQTEANFSNSAKALLALRGISEDVLGIYRNLQYNISLKVVGPGYERPTGGGSPTMMDVKVEVVAFGEVNQDVEI